MTFDPVRIGLFTELFASVAEEMGVVLERISYSPNIKERRDHSCAIFDKHGRLVAQAAHIPVHLGAMEILTREWLANGPRIVPGKHYVANDPYFGGTHLPDITILGAADIEGEIIGYVAVRAHHADIGGAKAGSMAPEATIESEGIIIRPGEFDEEIEARLLSASRNADERKGDLLAQIAACHVGATRFEALAKRFGSELAPRFEECLQYAERFTREAIRQIPDGSYSARDVLEDVPGGNQFAELTLEIRKSDDRITFDFTGTDDQRPIGLNATEAVTRSACYYVVRCLAPDAPTNGGCWAPIKVMAPKGTLVNATYPAPVVAGNTETSQRIVDLCLQALSKAMPDRIPACSQGTMNSIAFGKQDWAYYETIAGGAGGGPNRAGASAIHTHMTNTRNTPIEALEIELPLRIREYALRAGSGGQGVHRGGDGVVREFEVLEDGVEVSLMADRQAVGPPGAAGGSRGATGVCYVVRGGVAVRFPSKFATVVNRGDRVRMETPGGGGFGV